MVSVENFFFRYAGAAENRSTFNQFFLAAQKRTQIHIHTHTHTDIKPPHRQTDIYTQTHIVQMHAHESAPQNK